MDPSLTRHDLVVLVQRIMNSEGTEEEIAEWMHLVQSNVPHPAVSNLIFYPSKGGPPLSAKQIVDRALAYRPIALGPTTDPQTPPGRGT